MLAAMALPALAAQGADVSFKKVDNSSVSAKLPGRDPADLSSAEDAYADTDVVRVSILLDKAGTIQAGYSPEKLTSFGAKLYRNGLKNDQLKLVNKIEKTTGEALDVVWNLTLAANLISANVTYGQIKEIEALAGVDSVVIETRYEPDVVSSDAADPNMVTSGKQIGSAPAWTAGYTGAGSRIAIIDTGADTDHQSFSAAAYEAALVYNAGKAGVSIEEYKASLNLLTAEEIDKVAADLNAPVTGAAAYINSKIPFGYNYVDGDYDVTHDNDAQGSHGSHVSGIAAANSLIPSGDGFVSALTSAYVQGVAPDAQLITMKVFGKGGGAYEADYLAAIEDAIVLGCDSVNLSLGSGNPGRSKNSTAEYQAILDSLADCGVVVAMSAGNSGYWAESSYPGYLYADDVSMHTGGSPGSFTNSLGVASVENDGKVGLYFSVGDLMVVYNEMLEGNTGKYTNLPFSTLAGEQEYVFIDGIGSAEEWAAVGDALVGKIALCARGELSFFEKAVYAVDAGAIGTFIYNNQAGVINMDLTDYPYTEPCASLTQADGAAIKAASTPVTDDAGNVLYYTGKLTLSETMGSAQFNSAFYTMSTFSSWGVPGSLIMKPEITAPGGNIYSINGVDKSGTAYEVMSGTSMAAPQVAGMAALMAQYIKEAGLEEATGLTARQLAQSLLMSTAVPMLADAASYHSVLQQGAGLANVGAAVLADTYILMDANATGSWADGKVKAELGDDPARTGEYAFSFTINNLTDVEKLYNLSADFFIQAPTSDGYDMYMYTATALIGALSTFTVDGKEVTAHWDMDGADFNGDGAVTVLDGQALLDYATGARTELTNADKADFDADGDIDSHDAYLFLAKAESLATVPAGGSVKVDVAIEIPADWKDTIDYYYPNGTYLQGYVYADGVSTEEGVAGTSHSIPVLGFYGNWSDASMFDKGTYNEYAAGTEDRIPYLAYENFINDIYNGLIINYPGDPSNYWFGGNPMVSDDTYMPERDAISAVNGSVISKVSFAAIRNASDSYFVVKDDEGFWVAGKAGAVDAAYYYVNGDVWRNTAYTLDANFVPTGIPEGSVIDVGMMLVPEYYIDAEGSFDPAALGDGAYMTVPMTVDNTAPTLTGVAINQDLMEGTYTLNVDVEDNQYIAAVALFDIYGQYLYTYEGSVDQAAGDAVSYSLDLSEVNGPSFLLQVYDYAMNTTTYEIKTQIGEVVDYVDSITISDRALMMAKGSQQTLTAVVNPVNTKNRDVIWTTSDESVVTVENGVVTAVGAGSATVTATAAADETVFANCQITVVELNTTIKGVLQDAEGTPMLFNWDLASGNGWTAGSTIATEMNSLAYDAYADKIYGQSVSDMNMFIIDETTGELTKVSNAPCEFGAPVNDMAVSTLFGTAADPIMFGVFGGYFLGRNTPAENTFSTGWNLAAYLANYTGASKFVALCDYGIDYDAGVYSDVFLALDNAGYLWTLYYDGTSSISLGFIPTDLDLAYPTNGDSQYCSLISDAYGDLYLSYFTGSTNELYYLTLDAASRVFKSLYVGNVGKDVWPAALYMATPNETDDAEPAEPAFIDVVADAIQMVDTSVENEAVSMTKAPVTLKPMSASSVSAKEDMVTVNVTVKDAATNGVATVTFDTAALELVSVNVLGDYTSTNAADGSVTIGFVDLDGVAADAVVATLTFKPLNTEDTAVTVVTDELNKDKPGTVEVLDVKYPHANTEVKDAKDATCTEEGYTGDTYCADCGKLIAKGEVIPAKGHGETEIKDAKDATCTEEGYTGDTYCTVCGEKIADGEVIPAKGHGETEVKDAKDATCTEEGYTGDTYCTVCGEKIADGEAIPAKGHGETEIRDAKPATTTEEGYTGDTYCTVCGEKIAEGETIAKVDPENPKTSEETRAFLMATAAVMVAAGAAVIMMLSRKKLF